MAPLSEGPAARRLSGRCAKTPTGGSVAQWIAHWTSSVSVRGVIQRLWVRVPPESRFAAGPLGIVLGVP